jgi:hypothetical protein
MAIKILIGGDMFKIKRSGRRRLDWGVYRLMRVSCTPYPEWIEVESGFDSKVKAVNWLKERRNHE